MAGVLKNWREAATLLLVAKCKKIVASPTHGTLRLQEMNSELTNYNYKILMLKRSTKSKFMPNVYVFPGGIAEDADFSVEWLNLFRKFGDSENEDLLKFLTKAGKGPPMFSRKRNPKFEHIPSELAFRICAIRETFEESGVLIARTFDDKSCLSSGFPHTPIYGTSFSLRTEETEEWRERVDKNPDEFIRMCQALNVIPDVWSLSEWSNWLTPITLSIGQKSGRRYDTAFFLCVLDHIPDAMHDDKETVHLQWTAPDTLLREYKRSKGGLAPPQVYEVCRLLNYQQVDDLHCISWERALKYRVKQYFPVVVVCEDGVIVVYPGDELYPQEPDREGKNPPISINCSLSELSIKYPVMNRMFMKRSHSVNISSGDGQVIPNFDHDALSETSSSKL